jgi:hypothetical protein
MDTPVGPSTHRDVQTLADGAFHPVSVIRRLQGTASAIRSTQVGMIQEAQLGDLAMGGTIWLPPSRNATKPFILRGPSASERRRTSVPAPATVSASSRMGFSHRRDVLKATI